MLTFFKRASRFSFLKLCDILEINRVFFPNVLPLKIKGFSSLPEIKGGFDKHILIGRYSC